MRLSGLALGIALVATATAWAAPIDLGPPDSETTAATIAADSLSIVWLFTRMQLSDSQVQRTSVLLDRFALAKKDADKAEDEALLQVRDALAQEAAARLAGQDVPAEVESRVHGGLLTVVQAKARLRAAETVALSGFIGLLVQDQLLMVQWELEGPTGARYEALIDAYRRQADQTLLAVTQRMWPIIGDLLTLDQSTYRQRRTFLLGQLVGAAYNPVLRTGPTRRQQDAMRELERVFDGWRGQLGRDFPQGPPDQALRDIAPRVSADVLTALGIPIPTAQIPQPLVTESDLRRILLRTETAELLQFRVQAAQEGRTSGMMGVPPGYGPGPGGPGPGGPGPGPGGPR
jgi:hypothetical protein